MQYIHTFSSFSVDDLSLAKDFYQSTLGVEVKETPMGLELNVTKDTPIFVYPKPNHIPATFTVLNFVVENIDLAVTDLKSKGVKFELYDTNDMQTDKDSILRGIAANSGPDIAWFKDPAGNFLSVLQEK